MTRHRSRTRSPFVVTVAFAALSGACGGSTSNDPKTSAGGTGASGKWRRRLRWPRCERRDRRERWYRRERWLRWGHRRLRWGHRRLRRLRRKPSEHSVSGHTSRARHRVPHGRFLFRLLLGKPMLVSRPVRQHGFGGIRLLGNELAYQQRFRVRRLPSRSAARWHSLLHPSVAGMRMARLRRYRRNVEGNVLGRRVGGDDDAVCSGRGNALRARSAGYSGARQLIQSRYRSFRSSDSSPRSTSPFMRRRRPMRGEGRIDRT